MENKYQGKFERNLYEDDFKFCRLIDSCGLYRKWNGEIIIAKVSDKGTLEVLLHGKLEENIEDE